MCPPSALLHLPIFLTCNICVTLFQNANRYTITICIATEHPCSAHHITQRHKRPFNVHCTQNHQHAAKHLLFKRRTFSKIHQNPLVIFIQSLSHKIDPHKYNRITMIIHQKATHSRSFISNPTSATILLPRLLSRYSLLNCHVPQKQNTLKTNPLQVNGNSAFTEPNYIRMCSLVVISYIPPPPPPLGIIPPSKSNELQ